MHQTYVEAGELASPLRRRRGVHLQRHSEPVMCDGDDKRPVIQDRDAFTDVASREHLLGCPSSHSFHLYLIILAVFFSDAILDTNAVEPFEQSETVFKCHIKF